MDEAVNWDGTGGKQALAEATVEALGLPFTSRLGRAVNFQCLADNSDATSSTVSHPLSRHETMWL